MVTRSPVVDHFDGVAGQYDQVLPFFASFARQACAALTLPPTARSSTWPPGAARSAVSWPGGRAG